MTAPALRWFLALEDAIVSLAAFPERGSGNRSHILRLSGSGNPTIDARQIRAQFGTAHALLRACDLSP